VATFPLVLLVSSPPLLAACGSKPPETPLAHLYGREWVHGAYKLYATRYANVQVATDAASQDVYRVLAQKGIAALDALQSRDVPFYIRVDPGAHAFAVERKVPERLTFTSEMSDADRKAAEAAWKKARDHVHHDYDEIRRLDAAMTRLLSQLQQIRNAIEAARLEQFRLVDQLVTFRGDPQRLPYELPYQVTPKDYEEILLLLLERLDDDAARLARLEGSVITVGMTARATDANSATLAASLRKVLLAVVEDGAPAPRPPLYPADAEREAHLASSRALLAKVEASPDFLRWKAAEREKQLAALGSLLVVLDQMTGLPTSKVYRAVLDVWRGDRDYLGYLKTVISLVPQGGAVARTLTEAIEHTETARRVAGVVMEKADAARAAAGGGGGATSLAGDAKAMAAARLTAEVKGVVLNTASRFALDRAPKQLSFFRDAGEIAQVETKLSQTDLVTRLIGP